MKRLWLRPLIPLYAAGAALRWSGLKPRRLSWPVISVGNLSTGGTGKTPFTIALARLLLREGIHVDVLSRGYGRRNSGAARVNPEGSAEEFGDEPLLIARETGVPVYVARQRYQAGLLAEADSASQRPAVHLLDDGFQHRQLHRDVDILILNRQDWFEENLLPAGNLREDRSAVQRATVVAIPANEPDIEQDLHRTIPHRNIPPDRSSEGPFWRGPVWRFERQMEIPKMEDVPVVAFCGIARPEQFFSGLKANGVKLAATRAFPDHHLFTAKDLAMLRELVRAAGAGKLVTTAKDLVRLGELAKWPDPAHPVLAADIHLVLEDEAGIAAYLKDVLGLEAKASS